MKKTLIALAAAGTLAAGTLAVPQQAHAYAWWWIPAAVVGGVVVGGAVANSHAYAQGYAAPHYGPRGTVSVQPARGCYLQERPALWGGYRYVEVCR